MSQPSPRPEPISHRAAWRTWCGPALAAAGAIVVAAVLLRPEVERSSLSWWIAHAALTPERVLPLVGIGAALGLAPARLFFACVLLYGIGIALGFAVPAQLLVQASALPNIAAHNFLTGPVASLAAGCALVAGRRLRVWVLPPASVLAGIMLTLAILVTDPSLRDPSNRIAGLLLAFWIIGAVSLTLHAFRRGWFDLAGPILGSWLIAIALLYGGTALLPQRKLPEPSVPSSSRLPQQTPDLAPVPQFVPPVEQRLE